MKDKEISVGIGKIVDCATFEIGGIDQLEKLRRECQTSSSSEDEQQMESLAEKWNACKQDAQIKIGTLLKTDNVAFLLGAGASKHAGGVLLGSIPLEIEQQLLNEGTSGKQVNDWLKLWYMAIRRLHLNNNAVPKNESEILLRKNTNEPLSVNYESALSLLYRWRVAIPGKDGRLHLDGDPIVDTDANTLEECVNRAKDALVRRCVLPCQSSASDSLDAHKNFLKKVLTRPLNLKRVNLFTLNYDTMIEQAADAMGIVLLDGFVGTIKRAFRPESYDQDLYFPAETTEGRVHRLDRVIHVYKLHGSINWFAEEPSWDNPYGVSIPSNHKSETESRLIYPTPTKYGETLGMPYSELFRRFASSVARPQSTLFVIGYSFGDEHVNAIIRQALAIPSFTLVIVDPFAPDPDPSSEKFLACLRARQDLRVWVCSGNELGTFNGFVSNILPDLRDEEILGEVYKTHRVLRTKYYPLTTGESTVEKRF